MIVISGILCLSIGLLLKFFPTQKNNCLFGYRTSLSMKNQDTWYESQKFSASIFIVLGIIFILLQLIATRLNISYDSQILIVIIGLIFMLGLNDLHLKNTFNEDGTRKLP